MAGLGGGLGGCGWWLVVGCGGGWVVVGCGGGWQGEKAAGWTKRRPDVRNSPHLNQKPKVGSIGECNGWTGFDPEEYLSWRRIVEHEPGHVIDMLLGLMKFVVCNFGEVRSFWVEMP